MAVDRDRQAVREEQLVESVVEIKWAFKKHGGGPHAADQLGHAAGAGRRVMPHREAHDARVDVAQGGELELLPQSAVALGVEVADAGAYYRDP